MSSKLNLNNHFKNGEIDLSLSEIKEIPVKELAQLKKANSLDLSSNKIVSIGKNFPTSLTHIVKINLSKNLIKSLPENFGDLINLKHLDLYNNNLSTFPLSFGKLKKLEWLDVKGNPLMPKVAQITGPCTNKKQCEDAAKNTVKAYANMQKEVEAEKKSKLAEQKKKDKEEKAVAAQQQQQQQQQNKKQENNKKNKNKENVENNSQNQKSDKNGKQKNQQNGKQSQVQDKKSNKKNKNEKKGPSNNKPTTFVGIVFSAFASLFKLIFISTTIFIGSLFVLSMLDEDKFKSIIEQLSSLTKNYISRDIQNKIVRQTIQYGNNLKIFGNYVLNNISNFYIYITTDQTILSYKNNIKDYIHVTYIRISHLIDSYISSPPASVPTSAKSS